MSVFAYNAQFQIVDNNALKRLYLIQYVLWIDVYFFTFQEYPTYEGLGNVFYTNL